MAQGGEERRLSDALGGVVSSAIVASRRRRSMVVGMQNVTESIKEKQV